jgi:MYXO-CTERM domain-containing protein
LRNHSQGREVVMRSGVVRAAWCSLGILTAVHVLGGIALASVFTSTPEIDGGSISAGLGLLAAGILLVRSRRRSK